ncbi:MAG: HNH endonuclease [Xanthomonadales bacterium]|nr:HNH endonuclease [Xanthomonadales bacterium]
MKAISDAARDLNRDVLTLDEFEAHTGISGAPVRRHFGSWEKALKAAGLSQSLLGRRYTDEECFENILALWTHYGRQPIFGELKQPPSSVGPKAYIRRWGGWRAALTAFVKRVNESQEHSAQPATAEPVVNAKSSPSSVVPRSISLSLRYRVLARDNFRCVVCGASPAKDGSVELHVDHIQPWSRGGKNTDDNLRTLCLKCNLGKGVRTDAELTASS